MTGQDEQRPLWIVTGPLDPDKLPAGSKAAKLAPELLRLLEKLAKVGGAMSA